ncbi:MAG: hypothetical protein ABII01_02545 [Candidatus Woesearchaeota archaeon]
MAIQRFAPQPGIEYGIVNKRLIIQTNRIDPSRRNIIYLCSLPKGIQTMDQFADSLFTSYYTRISPEFVERYIDHRLDEAKNENQRSAWDRINREGRLIDLISVQVPDGIYHFTEQFGLDVSAFVKNHSHLASQQYRIITCMDESAVFKKEKVAWKAA